MVSSESPAAPAVRGLQCPSCGAAIELRTGELARTVACSSCGAVLDPADPSLRVLQRYTEKMRWKPLIPLGTRGTLRGDKYEAVGFQVRSITVDGTDYYWREYLLWSPYKAFRYLSEYDGHWNDITALKGTPKGIPGSSPPMYEYLGETFKHFQSAVATTRFVIGEFPWEVRLGDLVNVHDYVSPPHMLSLEKTAEEETWSLGTYVAPETVWKTFQLPDQPPAPRGVFANQPDPYGRGMGGMWKAFGLLALVTFVLLVVRLVTAQDAQVFGGRYTAMPPLGDSAAFVTPAFDVGGHTSDVEVRIDSDVQNNWLYFNLALIDEGTGTAYDFGREVSYYSGRDSDGSWSEGSTSDRVIVPRVPAGRYLLRVQPEGDPQSRIPVTYTIVVRRDVPRPTYYFFALVLLLAPPLLAGVRYWNFEVARWQESDHPKVKSSDE